MRLADRLGLRRTQQDDGVAMVAAIGLIGLVGIVMMAMLAFTLREIRQTGHDRQRSSAITTAEGATDSKISLIQDAAPAGLPCDSVDTTTSGNDSLTRTTTVTYYDAAGNGYLCPSATTSRDGLSPLTVSTVVNHALVSTTSTSAPIAGQAPAVRTMESYVRLTPTFANGLSKAIFGNQGVSLSNNGEIFGQNGTPNADVYTNGNFVCNNNQYYHGSVYAALGSITLSSTCTVEVNAWAKTGFSATNTGVRVNGDVKVSSGNASLVQNATVGGHVYANTFSGAYCSNHPNKCVTPSVPLGDPPQESFPVFNWDATTQALWEAQGYTVISASNDSSIDNCTLSGDSNGPGAWLMSHSSTLTQPTILFTHCQVIIQRNNNVIKLGNNLAVMAAGGVSFRNSLTIKSTSATQQRNLYLIQPYNFVATPCTTDGITLDNQVTIEDSVYELIYTPCNVRKANNSTHYGQIYAGGVAQIDNRLTMYYQPLPIWGIDGHTNEVESYAVDLLYKRENVS